VHEPIEELAWRTSNMPEEFNEDNKWEWLPPGLATSCHKIKVLPLPRDFSGPGCAFFHFMCVKRDDGTFFGADVYSQLFMSWATQEGWVVRPSNDDRFNTLLTDFDANRLRVIRANFSLCQSLYAQLHDAQSLPLVYSRATHRQFSEPAHARARYLLWVVRELAKQFSPGTMGALEPLEDEILSTVPYFVELATADTEVQEILAAHPEPVPVSDMEPAAAAAPAVYTRCSTSHVSASSFVVTYTLVGGSDRNGNRAGQQERGRIGGGGRGQPPPPSPQGSTAAAVPEHDADADLAAATAAIQIDDP